MGLVSVKKQSLSDPRSDEWKRQVEHAGASRQSPRRIQPKADVCLDKNLDAFSEVETSLDNIQI